MRRHAAWGLLVLWVGGATGAPRLRFCTALRFHFPEAWSKTP